MDSMKSTPSKCTLKFTTNVYYDCPFHNRPMPKPISRDWTTCCNCYDDFGTISRQVAAFCAEHSWVCRGVVAKKKESEATEQRLPKMKRAVASAFEFVCLP